MSHYCTACDGTCSELRHLQAENTQLRERLETAVSTANETFTTWKDRWLRAEKEAEDLRAELGRKTKALEFEAARCSWCAGVGGLIPGTNQPFDCPHCRPIRQALASRHHAGDLSKRWSSV